MSPDRPPSTNRLINSETASPLRRRQFLTLGAGAGATLLAGCTADAGPSDGDGSGTSSGGADGTDANAGTFRLLISDQPVAISDFDSLDVSFDRARIFGGNGAAPEAETGTSTATPTAEVSTTEPPPSETPSPTGSPTPTATVTETGENEGDGDGRGGFVSFDLGGATVDLTRVVGDKAIGVFEGELPEGRYTKIELYAAGVEGIVDGESVDVTIPSGKLQLVRPFEVYQGESLSFVFDINVVRKGQSDEYNLLPVISESGVAGADVEVEVVGNEADGDPAESGDAGTEGAEATDGPAGDAGAGDGAGEGDGSGQGDGST